MPSRRMMEISAVVAIYIVFVIVGVYGGQTIMDVDIISPQDGAGLRLSPVELVVRVTVGGAPVMNATTIFTVNYWAVGRTDTESRTDTEGIARVLLPATPGNYSWQVAAKREGYPKIMSSSHSFSVNLTLVVEPLLPSTFILALSPVDFKARVTDMNGRPVQSANVTFYVDSMMIGSNLTGQDGAARLSKSLTMGRHTWFASAGKEGEGGISDMTPFVVGQLAALMTGDSLSLQDRQFCDIAIDGRRVLTRLAPQG
jgi:hypothetical protein